MEKDFKNIDYSNLTDAELEMIRRSVNDERKSRKDGKQKPYKIFKDDKDFFYFCDTDSTGKFFIIKVKSSSLKTEIGRFYMYDKSKECLATKYTFKCGKLKGWYFLLDLHDANCFRRKEYPSWCYRLRIYQDDNNELPGFRGGYYRYYFTQEHVEEKIHELKAAIARDENCVERAKADVEVSKENLASFLKQTKKLNTLPRKEVK